MGTRFYLGSQATYHGNRIGTGNRLKSIKIVSVQKIEGGRNEVEDDQLAIEEPLEMCLLFWENGKEIIKSLWVTMRTPGDDISMLRGFLMTEKIASIDEIEKIEADENLVTGFLKREVHVETASLTRNFFMSSSCGVCGKATLEALRGTGFKPIKTAVALSAKMILALPAKCKKRQEVFSKTGGLHAAGAFTFEGVFVAIAEDVGRHNALDKLIGKLA